MKNKMPLDGLGLGHDSGSVHCDMLKMLCFRTAWGRGRRKSTFLHFYIFTEKYLFEWDSKLLVSDKKLS